MSAGSNLLWLGVAALGVALIAPNLSGEAPEAEPRGALQPAAPAPAPRAGNGYARREILRAADGHFYVDAQVNGASVRFLVDTGASVVALTGADARRAGIALPSTRASARGAGGVIEVIPVTIDRVAIGPLEARDVRAAVADQLQVSLLGQSYLERVGTVEISGDRMVLR
ncbi:MAG: TIGR02281 family clan AA aspartic protease [Alphaproteobacteria bacterium]|nr:MAG: TIGR02281 family clan AA aspartic protease [Alphaproteobacteria bacterium]